MGNTTSDQKISAQDRAILDMKNQRDKLQQYRKRITAVTDRETEIARECLAKGQKSRALLALRRKKYQLSLLEKTDLQLEQLQKLTADIEFAQVQKDVVFGLQQGTKVLKQIHAEMGGIEGVEKLLEDTAEAQSMEREISQLLGGQMSNEEEDEVEDELAAMVREMEPKQSLPEVPAGKLPERLPDVPSTELSKGKMQKARAEARKAREEALTA